MGDDSTSTLGFEERLGTNWLNKIGVAILVLGIASFLAYQFTGLGAAGKVGVGAASALLMIVGGARLERSERYRLPAVGLIAGGWGLLYFVAFAVYFVPATRLIDSQALDLALMLCVAGGMVVHTLRYTSQALTALAFLLSFATVTLHHDSAISLAAGAVLAAALVGVVRFRRWFVLEAVGIAATFGNHLLWLLTATSGIRGLPLTEYWPSTALLVSYWVVFRSAYLLNQGSESQERLRAGSAVLTTGMFLTAMRVQAVHPEWTFRFLVTMGLVELALGWLQTARRRRVPHSVLTMLGVSLLVAAVPFRFSGQTLDVIWLAQSEALVLLGLQLRERTLVRLGLAASGVLILRLALMEVVPALQIADWHVSVTLGAVAAVLYANVVLLSRGHAGDLEDSFESFVIRAGGYLGVAMILATCAIPGVTWMATSTLASAMVLAVLSRAAGNADLEVQTLALGAVGTMEALAVNLGFDGQTWGLSTRLVTLVPVVLCQYGSSAVLRMNRQAGTAASLCLSLCGALTAGLLILFEAPAMAVAPALALAGVLLIEGGLLTGSNAAHKQGILALLVSFARTMIFNLSDAGGPRVVDSRLWTVAFTAALLYWCYARMAFVNRREASDRLPASPTAWMATIPVVALICAEAPTALVAPSWAAMAYLLLSIAWATGAATLVDQALPLGAMAAFLAIELNLTLPTHAASLWQTRGGSTVATAAALSAMFAVTLLARRIRALPRGRIEEFQVRPEHWTFVATAALVTTMLAVLPRYGMITVAWGLEGVVIFLIALAVEERTFRLTGVGLLLVCVAKIVLIDIWSLKLGDRWITLVVLGGVLMLVSFLYTRYRDVLRRYL